MTFLPLENDIEQSSLLIEKILSPIVTTAQGMFENASGNPWDNFEMQSTSSRKKPSWWSRIPVGW